MQISLPGGTGNRLPLVAVIRQAYVFTFTHLSAIIALIWLPMVLTTVIAFFAGQYYFDKAIAATQAGTPALLGPALLAMLAAALAALLLYAVMYTAIVRLALGTAPAAARLSLIFGSTERRLFGGVMGFLGMAMLAVLTLSVVMAGVMIAAPGLAARAQGQSGEVAFVVIYLLFVFAAVRFLPLMPAIAVGETTPVLRRSWELSAGNFWRLLLLLLALAGPLALVTGGLEAMLLGPHFLLPGMGESAAQTLLRLQRSRQIMPLMSGLTFLLSPLMVGLLASGSAIAWRALSRKATDLYV